MIFKENFGVLQKGLDAVWLRNEVISNNIANADTPGFKASKVKFENYLNDEMGNAGGLAMKKSNSKHLSVSGGEIVPRIETDNSTLMRLDGNNVDVENEMVELAKNNLLYQTLIQKTSKEISKLKYAINEGKR